MTSEIGVVTECDSFDGQNLRWVLYCRVMGYRTPQEFQTGEDRRWPGGRWTGFSLWIDSMWRAWLVINHLPRDYTKSCEDYVAFDRWLADSVDADYTVVPGTVAERQTPIGPRGLSWELLCFHSEAR